MCIRDRTETVHVYTRAGKVLEGTLQLENASVHVNGEYSKTCLLYTSDVYKRQDVVLMDDQPSKIATAMRISKKTLRIVHQNIV